MCRAAERPARSRAPRRATTQGRYESLTNSPTSRTSPHEFRAGGMIGPVHLRVTVQAVLTEHVRRALSAGQPRRGNRCERRMTGLGVTTLAEHRATRLEHAGMNRTVGRMTGCAVFGDRRVLPQERPALVGVTRVARVIRGRLCQQRVIRAAMDVVTPGAGHLAGIDRMGKRTMLIHACDLVTRAADFRLRRRLEDGIPIRVTAMTAAACHFVDRMRTRMPTRAEFLLVTGSAHTVL